jgi:hypothetical protein
MYQLFIQKEKLVFMVIIFYTLSLIFTIQANADWKKDLSAQISCQIEQADSPESLRKQYQLLNFMVGGDTLTALKKQKFKHLTQYNLFINEFQQLSLIQASAKGQQISGQIQKLVNFMNAEGFLDPIKVCNCAYSEAEHVMSSKKAPVVVNSEGVREWFAKCITKQFIPTMYNSKNLEDKYN